MNHPAPTIFKKYRCTVEFSLPIPEEGYDLREYERNFLLNKVIAYGLTVNRVYVKKDKCTTRKVQITNIYGKFEDITTEPKNNYFEL